MKIPHAIEKRDLLHGAKNMSSSKKDALIESLVKDNWLADAIDFSADKPEKLKMLREKTVEEGDVFLFLKISRFLEDSQENDLLYKCAKKAEETGKIRYALMAFERLNKEADVARLEELIKDDADRQVEAEEDQVFIPEYAEEIDD